MSVHESGFMVFGVKGGGELQGATVTFSNRRDRTFLKGNRENERDR